MVASRRVVISGLGLLTPIGSGPDPFWQSLLDGKSGVRAIRAFDTSGPPVRFAGEVEGFDARAHVEKSQRKSLRMMARPIQLGVSAAQLALDQGRVDKGQLDPTRFGVEFGHGLI